MRALQVEGKAEGLFDLSPQEDMGMLKQRQATSHLGDTVASSLSSLVQTSGATSPDDECVVLDHRQIALEPGTLYLYDSKLRQIACFTGCP